MRKNFAQVLKETKVDIAKEYGRLYSIMFDEIDWSERSGKAGDTKTTHQFIGEAFPHFYFRDTALSLEDFDEEHGFFFEQQPKDFSIDNLVDLCEYSYNLLMQYQAVSRSPFYGRYDEINVSFIIEQIDKIIDKIGYVESNIDGFTVFVERSPAAIAVAGILPQEVSYKVTSYNHRSMRGNLEAKKNVLLTLSNLLEPQRKQLRSVWKSFEEDIFYAFNNLNLRHNNSDIKYVAKMSKADLEAWYDELYQMCLLAFLRLDHIERQKKFDDLKQAIESSRKEAL